MPVALPKQGDTLASKYRIDRTVGEGGMGVVFEAFHLRLRQRVAIKVLRPNILEHPELVARFEREARAAATLESPNVAKVLDVDTSPDGLPYMVIEFLEGNDLADELERRGRLPVQEAVGYVMEACMPIAEAHSVGIIHRDLKPSNLFLAKKGSQRVLKLLDFGISKVLTETDKNTGGSFGTLGTPHYMSPEHVRSSSDVDRRSDIWSLGVILYELLTGTEPYRGDPARVIAAIVADPVPPPRTRRPDIPEALEAVIMRCLEKEPKKRYPDVRALTTALAPFAAEEELVPATYSQTMPRSFSPMGIPAVRQAPRELPLTLTEMPAPAEPLPRRRSSRLLASAAAAAVAVFVVAYLATRSNADDRRPVAHASEPPITTQSTAPPPPAVTAVTTQSAEALPVAPKTSSALAAKPTASAPRSKAASSAIPFQL